MNDNLKNIRKNNIKAAIFSFIPASLFTFMLISMIVMYFYEYEADYLFLAFVCGFFAFFADKRFIDAIVLAINPMKDDVFKKYGTPENVSKIINEINQNKIYEDRNMIISKEYITDKENIAKLVACKDILGAHKVVHRTNFVIDWYGLEIIDKYRDSIGYTYGAKEENTVNQILGIIGSLCPNAEIGYTDKELKHINNNAEKLPKEIKQSMFKCSECGAICYEGDKYCKNCNAIFDEDEENDNSKSSFKCDNCGAIVPENATECPNCGELFEDESKEEIKDIDEIYTKAENYKNKGLIEKAKPLYTKYIEETEKAMKENEKKCYTFGNCIEFVLAVKKKLTDGDCIDINYNTSDAYLNLAFFAFDDKDYDSAIKLLKESLRLNPTGIVSLFEMAENYKAKGDLEKYLSWTEKCYDRLYNVSHLAHYYRNLGYYYIEKEEWNLAKTVLLYSLKYENNHNVENELEYIISKSKDESLPQKDELTSILRKNNIPTFISKENLNIIKELHKELEKNNQLNSNVGKFITKIMKENSNSA